MTTTTARALRVKGGRVTGHTTGTASGGALSAPTQEAPVGRDAVILASDRPPSPEDPARMGEVSPAHGPMLKG